jgi:hypothetical protein
MEVDMTKKVNVEVKVPYVRTITEFDKGGKHNQIRFDLKSGASRVWDLDSISEENTQYAKVDRIRNKAIDDFAGKSSNGDLVLKSLDAMYLRLQTGDWNTGRAGGFGGVVDLIHAVSDQLGKSTDEIQKLYDGLDETERKDWRDNADVQARVLRFKMERAEQKAKDAPSIVIKT